MSNVLIVGGSGLIGRSLSKLLLDNGFDVAILSRSRNSNSSIKQYYWNPEINEIDKEAFVNTDIIINLSGENVGDSRWTTSRKKQILDSRVKTVELLFQKAKEYNAVPKVFISASAVGFYGAINSAQIFSENDSSGNDFLAEVCRAWEEKIFVFESIGTRVVVLRTGAVLSKNGGALAKMLPLAKLGISTQLGNGKQYMPWIHIDDICRMYLYAINHSLNGVYNAVATEHITNKQFAELLSLTKHQKIVTPATPDFVLKLALGEMADMLLKGSRVSNDKILSAGFQFQFPNLKDALREIVT